VLSGYEPGKTRWLSKSQKKTLHSIAQPRFKADENAYRRVMNSLLIDLAYASSRLEDVHISWLDTKTLVELGERPEGLTDKEYRIVMNHKTAIQFICENRAALDLSKRNVCDVHKLLSHGLLGNPEDEGRIRRSLVYFTESAYKPLDNPFTLGEQLNLFCDKANAIADPFERAFFTMAMIPYLQPFQDGNKRTSRLCMNMPLLRESLAPFSFSQIDRRAYVFGLLAFYERGRPEFLAGVFFDTYVKSAPKYTELLNVVHDGGIISTLEVDQRGSR
jgi:Fic family protein